MGRYTFLWVIVAAYICFYKKAIAFGLKKMVGSMGAWRHIYFWPFFWNSPKRIHVYLNLRTPVNVRHWRVTVKKETKNAGVWCMLDHAPTCFCFVSPKFEFYMLSLYTTNYTILDVLCRLCRRGLLVQIAIFDWICNKNGEKIQRNLGDVKKKMGKILGL